ncbi:MAG: hypothetical protein GY799_25330 [Desulfobulbaceae bacterium]|nr:hypothetical protein [Desulfobulbaceae bacterium]
MKTRIFERFGTPSLLILAENQDQELEVIEDLGNITPDGMQVYRQVSARDAEKGFTEALELAGQFGRLFADTKVNKGQF